MKKALLIPLLCVLGLGAAGCGTTNGVLPPVSERASDNQSRALPANQSRALPANQSRALPAAAARTAENQSRALPAIVAPPPPPPSI